MPWGYAETNHGELPEVLTTLTNLNIPDFVDRSGRVVLRLRFDQKFGNLHLLFSPDASLGQIITRGPVVFEGNQILLQPYLGNGIDIVRRQIPQKMLSLRFLPSGVEI